MTSQGLDHSRYEWLKRMKPLFLRDWYEILFLWLRFRRIFSKGCMKKGSILFDEFVEGGISFTTDWFTEWLGLNGSPSQ